MRSDRFRGVPSLLSRGYRGTQRPVTYAVYKVGIGKYLSDAFPIQSGLKQDIKSLLFNFHLECAIMRVPKKIRRDYSCIDHISFWSMVIMLVCCVDKQISQRVTYKL